MSFGFQAGRSAHGAVEAARRAIEAGETRVVDVDLDRLLDRVRHDALHGLDRLTEARRAPSTRAGRAAG